MNVHEELTLAPCPYCRGMHQAGTSEQCPLNPNRGEQSMTVTNGYATLEWHTQCAALLLTTCTERLVLSAETTLALLSQHRDEMREAAHAL
jgi:hypothetical protein